MKLYIEQMQKRILLGDLKDRPEAPQVQHKTADVGVWEGCTRRSGKRKAGDEDLRLAAKPANLQPKAFKRLNAKRKMEHRTHMPLLSRESRDQIPEDGMDEMMAEMLIIPSTCPCNRVSMRLGSSADFAAIRNLYDHQDHVTKVVAQKLVDGGMQKFRARNSFAHKQGCQVQHFVE